MGFVMERLIAQIQQFGKFLMGDLCDLGDCGSWWLAGCSSNRKLSRVLREGIGRTSGVVQQPVFKLVFGQCVHLKARVCHIYF
jgi:hypothetical protein